jgi:hypothetical protein
MLATASDRGDGHVIGIEFFVKEFERGMVGFAFDGLECGECRMEKLVRDGCGHVLCRKVRVVKDVLSGGRLSMCGQRCRG